MMAGKFREVDSARFLAQLLLGIWYLGLRCLWLILNALHDVKLL